MPQKSIKNYDIQIKVQPRFVERGTFEDSERYVFSYTITILNTGSVGSKLLSRYWHIRDGEERTEEVRGEGVVGEQPHLLPGEAFQYTSGAVLESPVGTMEGVYYMIADDGNHFEVNIPRFVLSASQYLH